MKILIIGAKGQLGSELYEMLLEEAVHEVKAHDKETLDITNYEQVQKELLEFKPDVIINTAAYTNVDGCETDYRGAYLVNVVGAMNLARASESISSKLIHISTDFVFEGLRKTPYFEYDETNPISAYGKTKLAGEWAVRNETKRHFILRTSWLYGKNGNNFVKTMIKIGKQNSEVKVVIDQVGTPTYTKDLIFAIKAVMNTELYGTYHFSNEGECSWNGFAKKIFELMDMKTEVLDTSSAEFIRPAKRPSYSVMDKNHIKAAFLLNIPTWENSLQAFIESEKTNLMGL